MKKLTEEFNVVSVKKGEVFEVELESNPTTGFIWDVAPTRGRATFLCQSFEGCAVPPAGGVPLIGTGGIQRFLFRAEETGTIEMKAEYSRKWEKRPPLKSCTFQVKVD